MKDYMSPLDGFIFEGFEPANTTPVPDVLFDKLLTKLTGAELKVLLYIMRRTWGFKKDTDAISISQFQKGITKKDGEVLDEGCGVKDRDTIVKSLASLEKMGCIESVKGKTTNGDNAVSTYRIRFAKVVGKTDYPLVGKTNHPSRENQPPRLENPTTVVGKSNPQETVLQNTVSQETVLQDNVLSDDENAATQTDFFSPEKPEVSYSKQAEPTPAQSAKEEKPRRGSRKLRAPKESEVSAEVQAKITAVFHCLDTFAREATKDEEFSFSRTKTASKDIKDLIEGRPVSEKHLHMVFFQMWNAPDGKDGFRWKDHMSVAAICRHYDSMLLKAIAAKSSPPSPPVEQNSKPKYRPALSREQQNEILVGKW